MSHLSKGWSICQKGGPFVKRCGPFVKRVVHLSKGWSICQKVRSICQRCPRTPIYLYYSLILWTKSASWTLGSSSVERDSVVAAASLRDLELDFPCSPSADRESRTSKILACESASKIDITSQMSTAQRGGIFPVFRIRERREYLSKLLTMSAKQLLSQSSANSVDRT